MVYLFQVYGLVAATGVGLALMLMAILTVIVYAPVALESCLARVRPHRAVAVKARPYGE